MTIAYWCVLIAAVMPIVWAGAAKSGAKGFNNARPREFLGSLSGWPARANFAQQNAYEAFPPFAAGVIIAHLYGLNLRLAAGAVAWTTTIVVIAALAAAAL